MALAPEYGRVQAGVSTSNAEALGCRRIRMPLIPHLSAELECTTAVPRKCAECSPHSPMMSDLNRIEAKLPQAIPARAGMLFCSSDCTMWIAMATHSDKDEVTMKAESENVIAVSRWFIWASSIAHFSV